MHAVRNKRVTVAGLGRFGGGIAVSRWLVQQGARVLVTDQADAGKLGDSLRQLDGLPIEFRLGEHRREDFTAADLVVASPAIPRNNEFLQAARQAGVPVTTEICLVVERLTPKVIFGVTGTKGKSTSSAMLGQMLKRRGTTWFGGNIGGSLLFDLPKMSEGDWVVLELSSYMLDYLGEARWSPHVGLVTLIAQDHLQWHGSMEAYVSAKINLLRFQGPEDVAVLNGEDEKTRALAQQTRAQVVYFTLEGRAFELLVPGRHNQLNAQGAFAAARQVGVTWEEAQGALREFKGLPHRLQLVHEAGGVRYYNDSIATIPEAAVAALDAFAPRTVLQIVGGYDKHLPMDALTARLAERAKGVLCIGTTGPAIQQALSESHAASAPPVYACGDLATAVALGRRIAEPGDVVLLSTGCASYDQFVNFEQRGDAFARLAQESVDESC
jgi:UDP-N-acetylmuramoylalanine--D-glutamate ligase